MSQTSIGRSKRELAIIAPALLAAAMFSASSVQAANQYYATSSSAGLQAGNGPWSTNNGAGNRQWKPNADGSGSADSWNNGSDAFFQTSGSSLVTIDTANQPTANSVTFNGTGYTIQTGTLTLNGTHTITTNANATINSAIGGTVGFIKAGTSNLTLGGTSTVTGATAINAGTLTLNGSYSSSANAADAVSVNSIGTLAGTGTINRIVNLNAGGALSPAGDGTNSNVGTITTNAHNWAGTSTYVWEIKDATGVKGTGYDTLNVNGTLTVNATSASKMTIKVVSHGAIANFVPTDGYHWTIGTASTVSNFDSNAFTLDVSDFIDDHPTANAAGFFVTQSGSTVRVTYVPEPASALLIGLAGCAGVMRRRRNIPNKANPH